jgi:hypothetical protein
VVPGSGYIGGVGWTHGVEVVGILATPLKELMAEEMGTYNGKAFLAVMEQAGVLVADPKHPRKALGLRYTRADNRAVNLRHLCFRRANLVELT